MARTSRPTRVYFTMSGLTTWAYGHRRRASNIGIADFTPKVRAIKQAVMTTPPWPPPISTGVSQCGPASDGRCGGRAGYAPRQDARFVPGPAHSGISRKSLALQRKGQTAPDARAPRCSRRSGLMVNKVAAARQCRGEANRQRDAIGQIQVPGYFVPGLLDPRDHPASVTACRPPTQRR
jgi:hypothetical protein